MRNRAVSWLLVILTVLSLISPAYAGTPIVSGDLPNYLTVYGNAATLAGKAYQPRNKYNDEYYRYHYTFDAEPYADVISEYKALLEKYDIWLADTWTNRDGDQTIYYFEYRGPKTIRPVTTLATWSEKSQSKPCIIFDVEIFSALRGSGPITISMVISGDLNYLEPDYSKFDAGADAVHMESGETTVLSCTNIPYANGKLSETYHWEILDGGNCISLDRDNMKDVTVRALNPGTAHLLCTYEYSVEGGNILTGKKEYVFHSATQNFTIVVGGEAGPTGGKGEADVVDFLGFFGQDDFIADAVNDYREISREPYVRYYYLPVNPKVWIDTAIVCYDGGYGPFRLIQASEGQENGYAYTEYFFEYTGEKNVSAYRFEENDPCEAHMKITESRSEGELDLVWIDLVSGLTYGGADQFY